jgi:hypothetical protein
MKVITRCRGRGKTTEIIMRAIKEKGFILVLNESRKKYVEDIIKNMHLDESQEPKVITPFNNLRGIYISKILIDDADEIIYEKLNELGLNRSMVSHISITGLPE